MTEAQNKFEKKLNILRDELTILESLPESVREEFKYNFDKLNNKILRARINDENRSYTIHSSGYMKEDGYEKHYVYVFKGSYVKFQSGKDEKEYVQIVDKDGNVKLVETLIGEDSSDIKVGENTLFKVYRFKPEGFKKQ